MSELDPGAWDRLVGPFYDASGVLNLVGDPVP